MHCLGIYEFRAKLMRPPRSTHDDLCCEALISIMNDYVEYAKKTPINRDVLHALKQHYEEWRNKIRNPQWRAYLSFDVMEKLTQQEYLIDTKTTQK